VFGYGYDLVFFLVFLHSIFYFCISCIHVYFQVSPAISANTFVKYSLKINQSVLTGLNLNILGYLVENK